MKNQYQFLQQFFTTKPCPLNLNIYMRAVKLICIIFFIGLTNLCFGQAKFDIVSLQHALRAHTRQDTVRVNLLTKLGYALYRNKAVEAAQFHTEALALSTQLNYTKGKADASIGLGFYHRFRGEYPQALSYSSKARQLYHQLHDGLNELACYYNLVNIYRGKGEFVLSVATSMEALSLANQLHSQKWLILFNNILGRVYLNINNTDKAIYYINLALQAALKINDKDGLQHCYGTLADVYLARGEWNKALLNSEKSMVLNKEINNKQGIIENVLVTQNTKINKGDLNNVLPTLYQTITDINNTQDYGDMPFVHDVLSRAYLRANRPDSAVKYGLLSLKANQVRGEKANSQNSSEVLAKAYAALGKFKEAYQYQLLFTHYTDSINLNQGLHRLDVFQYTADLDKKQSQIALLKSNTELISKESRQQKILLIFMIGGLLATGVFSFVLLKNNRQKQLTNKLLNQQNNEIEAQKREAQIEVGLERVRTVAMGMNKPDDLLNICRSLFKELQLLEFTDLRNAIIHTYIKRDYFIDYDYSDFTKGHISKIPYSGNPILEKFVKDIRKTKDAFTEIIISGVELTQWKAFRDANDEAPDDRLNNATSIYYYIYSIGEASIGISTFTTVPFDKQDVLKRFRNVFDLAYRRYSDIELAEAQKREAQIEVALERVRSRTMAMHKSNELPEVSSLLFQQVKELGETAIQNSIGIVNEQTGFVELSTTIRGSHLLHTLHVPINEKYLMAKAVTAWNEKQISLKVKFEGQELKDYNNYRNSFLETKVNFPEDQWVVNISFFSKGWLSFSSNKDVPDEIVAVQKRFAAVFDQTYTRFLDLQKAEAQARESKVHLALEHTRTQSMIMQHSNELDDMLRVFHEQVLQLGIKSAFSFLWLPDEAKDRHVFWAAWAEDDSKVLMSKAIDYPLDREEPATAQCLLDWRGSDPVVSYHVPPNGVESYFVAWNELIAGVKQLNPQYFSGGLYYVEAFMKYGCFGVMTPIDLTTDEKNILEKFATEFEHTYTRFLDLKKAEANALQAEINLIAITVARKNAEDALTELKATQTQLIQSEKMASLGELTAGIAHEIQNPLNFVNNFSEVSVELLEELKEEAEAGNKDDVLAIADDLTTNLQKINHHGKRADAIVKGMLEHSRASSGQKELTDMNGLADEYLRLAYHGLRAKDKSFNAALLTNFDNHLPKVNVIPQDMGRVLLNLFNNAFYATQQKAKTAGSEYKPTLTVSTFTPPSGGWGASVSDNGNGIPDAVKDKIMQPFFTTKPTGEGTGLGLSLSYDIVVKGHGGSINVESTESEGTEFIVTIPLNS